MEDQQIPYQNIPKGTSTEGYVNKLIDFIGINLATFNYEVDITESERKITDKIYRHLQRQSRLSDAPFDFQPETLQEVDKGHDKSTDIGVNLNTYDIDMELIYCIEAKRLPTDHPNAPREKEYVIGKKGGISRFKNNDHGKNRKGKLLSKNGMIGYVQQNNSNHWFREVNSWITNDTDWGVVECLKNIKQDQIFIHESSHTRVTGEKVHLTHFWLDFIKE